MINSWSFMDIYVKERMNLFIAFIISQLDLFANFKYFIRIPNYLNGIVYNK